MAFTNAARLSDVPVGAAKQVSVAGKTLALCNIGGVIHAIDNECPHRNAPLAEGTLQGTELECPWHGARFDVCTGAVLAPPARAAVKSYKVQIVGDEVQVDI